MQGWLCGVFGLCPLHGVHAQKGPHLVEYSAVTVWKFLGLFEQGAPACSFCT